MRTYFYIRYFDIFMCSLVIEGIERLFVKLEKKNKNMFKIMEETRKKNHNLFDKNREITHAEELWRLTGGAIKK